MTALSFVVATRGRPAMLGRLLASLAACGRADVEVIVLDQGDTPPGERPDPAGLPFPVTWIPAPGQTGVSRGRNAGARAASGRVLVFPDDDCWYPPDSARKLLARMRAGGIDVLTGRASDAEGRDVNGRFHRGAARIDLANVTTTGQMEWLLAIDRDVFAGLGGFDEALGLGAGTPWGAAEGIDLVLRAVEAGFTCVYDPDFVGHHDPYDLSRPRRPMRRKLASYGRGLGFVLGRHGAGAGEAAYWAARAFLRAAAELACGRGRRFLLFAGVGAGRASGWNAGRRTRRR